MLDRNNVHRLALRRTLRLSPRHRRWNWPRRRHCKIPSCLPFRAPSEQRCQQPERGCLPCSVTHTCTHTMTHAGALRRTSIDCERCDARARDVATPWPSIPRRRHAGAAPRAGAGAWASIDHAHHRTRPRARASGHAHIRTYYRIRPMWLLATALRSQNRSLRSLCLYRG